MIAGARVTARRAPPGPRHPRRSAATAARRRAERELMARVDAAESCRRPGVQRSFRLWRWQWRDLRTKIGGSGCLDDASTATTTAATAAAETVATVCTGATRYARGAIAAIAAECRAVGTSAGSVDSCRIRARSTCDRRAATLRTTTAVREEQACTLDGRRIQTDHSSRAAATGTRRNCPRIRGAPGATFARSVDSRAGDIDSVAGDEIHGAATVSTSALYRAVSVLT